MLVYLFADEIKKLITSTLGVSNDFFVFIALIVLAIVGLLSSVIVIVYDKLNRTRLIQRHDISVIVSHCDPKFSHIEARLFYPPKHRWHKIRVLQKHWWELWKQTPSRHKLILVKDLKKAHWVGKHGWNLIIEGKIEWISEEDQDLDQWCEKNGYTPSHEVVDEDKLLEPYFKAEIRDKKSEYRLGEAILFRTHYRGKLINGFFSNQIFAPTGKSFTDGSNRKSSFPFDTLESGDPNIQGKLDGFVNHSSDWSWGVSLDAPLGQYRIYMRVHNHFRADNRPVVVETQDSFVVVSDSNEEKGRHKEIEQETSFEETKTELLKALHFFPEHWETYKELIKKNQLKSPQSGEIKWSSDQIKSAIIRARMLNLNEINAIIPQVEAVSDDIAKFGMVVSYYSIEPIRSIVHRGDVICKKVKQVISTVEKAL